MPPTPFRARIFAFVPICCFLFVLFTGIAMAFYPGGVKTDHGTQGYSFLVNFFSDLGRRTALNGQPNPVAASLFQYALTLAGLGLMLFFGAFGNLFSGGLVTRVVALWGGALGILSGACFVGVAAFPVDFSPRMHGTCVIWAFRFFLLAVLPFIALIFSQKRYPKTGAWLFVTFALLLTAYIQLLTFGPNSGTPGGLIIQVTGQKVIVYTSVVCVWLQSVLARRFLQQKLAA
ncbi:hypothetical protein EON80_20620 [bacterium]|nr:MAG: hypothetical protein EON80_20620 [bacterium]